MEKYRIIKPLGQGGMSNVYLVEDRLLKKKWAMKVVDLGSKTGKYFGMDLFNEAMILKDLDHPILPRIVEVFKKKNKICMVMDYVEGISLEDLIKKDGGQDESIVIRCFLQIADCLSYLHSSPRNIIYKDMKPANIIFTKNGGIKLIDFGISNINGKHKHAFYRKFASSGYAPPEQYMGDNDDPRIDIYGLGMTMYSMITGLDPNSSNFIYKPIREIRPDVTEELEDIVNTCLNEFPEDRFKSAKELIMALKGGFDKIHKKKIEKKRKFLIVTMLLTTCLVSLLLILQLQKEKNNKNIFMKDFLIGIDKENINIKEITSKRRFDIENEISINELAEICRSGSIGATDKKSDLKKDVLAVKLILRYMADSFSCDKGYKSDLVTRSKIKKYFFTDGEELLKNDWGPWGEKFKKSFIKYFECKEGI